MDIPVASVRVLNREPIVGGVRFTIAVASPAETGLFAVQLVCGRGGGTWPLPIQSAKRFSPIPDNITPKVVEGRVLGVRHLEVYNLEVDMISEGFRSGDRVLWKFHVKPISVLDMINECS